MSKIILWLVVAVAVGAGAFWLFASSDEQSPNQTPTNSNSQPAGSDSASETVPAGQYAQYDEAELANDYERHILFFHASWCPECRAFEQTLLSSELPQDVQILKVDYDTATDLKQKYGVTIQTTFVEVDDAGELIAKWVGYGEDKSFAAVDNGLAQNQ